MKVLPRHFLVSMSFSSGTILFEFKETCNTYLSCAYATASNLCQYLQYNQACKVSRIVAVLRDSTVDTVLPKFDTSFSCENDTDGTPRWRRRQNPVLGTLKDIHPLFMLVNY